jgi:hypothetical protein
MVTPLWWGVMTQPPSQLAVELPCLGNGQGLSRSLSHPLRAGRPSCEPACVDEAGGERRALSRKSALPGGVKIGDHPAAPVAGPLRLVRSAGSFVVARVAGRLGRLTQGVLGQVGRVGDPSHGRAHLPPSHDPSWAYATVEPRQPVRAKSLPSQPHAVDARVQSAPALFTHVPEAEQPAVL